MAITYYMLQIPSYFFFIIITVFGALFAVLFTFSFRKQVKINILRSHNEVTGFLFLAIASFYALLLSFIVLVVWDQYNETKGNVSREGSAAASLYRDIKYYPDTLESKQLLVLYNDFVHNVIEDEFPNMEHMQTSRKTSESFNRLFYKLEHLKPQGPFEIQLVAEMFNNLNNLADFRGLRMASMETEIAPSMWLPMILGALFCILCASLLDIESIRVHIFLNAMLGSFVGMFFFIIITLDHPFSGKEGIKPTMYEEVKEMEVWSKENARTYSLGNQ